ncbi:hypothetical protein ACRAWD_13495 [Caulobacter segnis]
MPIAKSSASSASNVWIASGVRTPFAKVDGPLASYDAIEPLRSGGEGDAGERRSGPISRSGARSSRT